MHRSKYRGMALKSLQNLGEGSNQIWCHPSRGRTLQFQPLHRLHSAPVLEKTGFQLDNLGELGGSLGADSWVVVSWQNKHLDLAQQKPQTLSQAGIKGLLAIRDTICLHLYSTSYTIQTSINTCGGTGMACSVASAYRKWNVWTLILTT